jgi:hypothetical protein
MRLPALSQPWTALSVSTTLWFLILLFAPGLIVQGNPAPSVGFPGSLSVLRAWQVALVLLPAGFFSGAALSRAMHLPGLLTAVSGFVTLWIAALIAYQTLFGLGGTLPILLLGIPGLILGLIAGFAAAPGLKQLSGRADANPDILSYLALGCALLLAFAPIARENPVTSPFAPLPPLELAAEIPQQVYILIKAVMLWVPLGFVLAAGGLSEVARRWAPAGIAGFFLTGWPYFDILTADQLSEILSAPIGIWIGLRLGEQMGSSPKDVATTRSETMPMPMDPATPPLASDPAGRARTTAVVAPVAQNDPRPSAESAESTATAGTSFALPRPHPIALMLSLGTLAGAGWGLWTFPRFQVPLGIALVLYLLLLVGFRHAWLIVIPALLPVLDLAPWTGRFFLDESDLFLLVTVGAALLHRPHPQAGPFLPNPIVVLGWLFAASTLLALIAGLLPLSPLDSNAFANYFSHFNALRVGKGFVWGLVFFLLLRWTIPRGSEIPARLFTAGILVGLLGVILIGVQERLSYADLLDFSVPYRITASFSSMHTGGSHLPAFLVLAVPFVWLWVVRRRDIPSLIAGPALLAGAAYLVVATVTRAGFLAFAVEVLLLSLFWLRGMRGRQVRIVVPLLALATMLAVAGSIFFLGTHGSFFQQRMATVERDANTRLTHWSQALWMMDRDLATQAFGMGLGTFPETYFQRNPGGLRPGNFRYAKEGDNIFLLLGSGELLYLAQRVAVEPDTRYRLSFDLRGDGDRVRLTMPLCEKHLLDSRDCVWDSYGVLGTGEWEHEEVALNSGSIGHGHRLSRPPVELFLYNGEKDLMVAVDNLSLRAPDGTELLRNGDFSAGGDSWFFKTHDHLAWHIKNLWVSLMFEQGWLGLIAFNLLVLAVFIHAGGPAWRGSPVPAAVVAVLAGFLSLGLFSSPFDAPRLTALFFAVLAVGLHAVPAIATNAYRPRRRKRGRRPGRT